MNESILNSLMQLYALIAFANKEADSLLARSFVESYLTKYFSKKIVGQQLAVFDFYIKKLNEEEKVDNDLHSTFSVRVLKICQDINKELHQTQKLLVLINLLQFLKHWKSFSVEGFDQQEMVTEIVETVALVFNFEDSEFNNLKSFIYDQVHKMPDKKSILIIHDNPYFRVREINTMQIAGLNGEMYVLHIENTNTYLIRYNGSDKLEIMGRTMFPNHIYLLDKGTSIKAENIESIYYSDIVGSYLHARDKLKIKFEARDIEFLFPKSENGIHKFSFSGISGQMIGIMGGSGTGKSTLLNMLNGNLPLKNGNIYINGLNIHSHKEEIEGIIGYVPQDDLLVDELTVYQNLCFNAKLCLGNLNDEQIKEKVEKLLLELDLYEIRYLKVGDPLNKFISGGQRKRLNIALELIREPYVLFLDEPTSGLSSTDSEKVIELLKEQALNGKFLVVNIHQPSSNIFKQFDQLIVLDKGGYPVYNGNPLDAIVYVRKITGMIDAAESECHCCGNVNPDQILESIEYKDVDEFGKFSNQRKIAPEKWYTHFLKNIKPPKTIDLLNKALPEIQFKVPGYVKQFKIFSIRNFLAKIADQQYLYISLLVTPLLALILSFLTKYLVLTDEHIRKYIFYQNENIPAFFFVSIVVALFVGLVISAEEIIKDRKILKRESFLNLSKSGYLNAKIIFLLGLSLIQSIAYVLISCWILEIKGFMFPFWLIFFSLSFFANLTGLNISSAFKSVVTIYVLIPLILVPQILLGGVFVKFNKLHPLITSEAMVPVVGDLMASRWAYEALMVTQFKDNRYQKHFFELDKKTSESSFTMNYRIPELKTLVFRLTKELEKEEVKSNWKQKLLYYEIKKIQDTYYLEENTFVSQLLGNNLTKTDLNEIKDYLEELKLRLAKYIEQLIKDKDEITTALEQQLGKDKLNQLKFEHVNNRVNEFVLNNKELDRIRVTEDKLIQIYEPVYLTPDNKHGRAQFYASVKRIGNLNINTFWFNVLIIWLFNAILYVALLNGWLKKIIEKIDKK